MRNAILPVLAGLLLLAAPSAKAQSPVADKSADSYTTVWNTNRARAATRELRSYSIALANDTGSTVYIHCFDASSLSVVTNNATPIWVGIPVATATVGTWDTPYSVPLQDGLCVAASSSRYKLTLVNNTNLAWTVIYKDRK